METIRLDGRVLAGHIQQQLRSEVVNLPHKPHLAVILVGESAASALYVNTSQHRKTAIFTQRLLPLFQI